MIRGTKRSPGRPDKPLNLWLILGGAGVVVGSFFVALILMNWFAPGPSGPTDAPRLTEVPPLQPITRSSVVVAPAAVTLSAIRDAMEAAAPRNLAGKKEGRGRDNIPLVGDIGWTLDRGPLAVSGRTDSLVVATNLNGTFRITGKLGEQVGGAVGNVLGGAVSSLGSSGLGRQLQDFTGKTLDQRVDVRGNVNVVARPTITPNWRVVPNLAGAASISDVAVPIAGFRLSVSNEVKPFVDQAVREQVAALEGRIRNDPFLEHTARGQWAKMCRSIPLGAAGAGLPNLWLEVRPTRAFAAQPRVDAQAVHLTLGIEAQTRVVPGETKPDCPFPAQLEIAQALDKGKVSIGVPIDVPFTEVNKLLEAQLSGKTFPDDGSGPVDVTVRNATVAASGDRLLISLRVRAKEKKSWFGFGAEAMLHIYGRPVLDTQNQILRLTDLQLAVESEAAFGLLGAAARTAEPQLRKALADKAVVDLKPFAADAKKRVDAGLGDFRRQQAGVQANIEITDLRLVDIAFDAKTLRIIAEADGVVDVAVSNLAVP